MELFQLVCDINDSYMNLNPQDRMLLQEVLKSIGFESDIGYLSNPDKMAALQSARFQLTYLSHLLLRKQNPVYFPHKDIKYYPDDWQAKLLKQIQNKESVLVVSPTSSGKSVLSLFAISTMAKHQSGGKARMRSKVVFVSPTLALANEMTARVHRLYDPKVIKFGVFTR